MVKVTSVCVLFLVFQQCIADPAPSPIDKSIFSEIISVVNEVTSSLLDDLNPFSLVEEIDESLGGILNETLYEIPDFLGDFNLTLEAIENITEALTGDAADGSESLLSAIRTINSQINEAVSSVVGQLRIPGIESSLDIFILDLNNMTESLLEQIEKAVFENPQEKMQTVLENSTVTSLEDLINLGIDILTGLTNATQQIVNNAALTTLIESLTDASDPRSIINGISRLLPAVLNNVVAVIFSTIRATTTIVSNSLSVLNTYFENIISNISVTLRSLIASVDIFKDLIVAPMMATVIPKIKETVDNTNFELAKGLNFVVNTINSSLIFNNDRAINSTNHLKVIAKKLSDNISEGLNSNASSECAKEYLPAVQLFGQNAVAGIANCTANSQLQSRQIMDDANATITNTTQSLLTELGNINECLKLEISLNIVTCVQKAAKIVRITATEIQRQSSSWTTNITDAADRMDDQFADCSLITITNANAGAEVIWKNYSNCLEGK